MSPLTWKFSTSSTGSSKSKREAELETKIAWLDSIVAAQMAMMASMQKTMELLTIKMTTHENLLSQDHDSETVCKRQKQGPIPQAIAHDRNGHPSNTGTDSPAAEPPDPGQADPTHNTNTQPNPTCEPNQSMESVETEINGGITDADLSIAMQDDATPPSPIFEPASPIKTISPAASSDDEL